MPCCIMTTWMLGSNLNYNIKNADISLFLQQYQIGISFLCLPHIQLNFTRFHASDIRE